MNHHSRSRATASWPHHGAGLVDFDVGAVSDFVGNALKLLDRGRPATHVKKISCSKADRLTQTGDLDPHGRDHQ